MSTDLATLSSSNLDPRTAFNELKSVEQIVNSIDSADILVDVIDRAKLAQEWLKVKNCAAEVVVQATRVQLAAIRRIGQLGEKAVAVFPEESVERRYAPRLAELTDARFAGELDALERPIKASTFIQNMDNQHGYATWLNKGYDIGHGKPSSEEELYERAQQAQRLEREAKPKTPKQKARDEADRQAREDRERRSNDTRMELLGDLLRQLYREGDPFSVSDATDQMLDVLAEHDMLDFGDPREHGNYVSTRFIREGVAAAIRHALMDSAAFDDSGYESVFSPDLGATVHPPKFVTYSDDDAGWVRIPWRQAGLAQLREMAELRKKQANELAEKSAHLAALVAVLEDSAARHPDEKNCANLLRNAKRKKAGVAA